MQTTNQAIDLALNKAIVDQAPDAVIFADTDGKVVIWNSGAERIFGHTAADVIGGPLDIIIPEQLLQGHNNGFSHAMSSGQMKYADKVLTTRSMHKDGTRIYVCLLYTSPSPRD